MGLLSEFPLQDGQPTKANDPHPPGVSLVILRQVLAVTLYFWLLSRGYHVEVEVGLGICSTLWMSWPSMEFTHTNIQ